MFQRQHVAALYLRLAASDSRAFRARRSAAAPAARAIHESGLVRPRARRRHRRPSGGSPSWADGLHPHAERESTHTGDAAWVAQSTRDAPAAATAARYSDAERSAVAVPPFVRRSASYEVRA